MTTDVRIAGVVSGTEISAVLVKVTTIVVQSQADSGIVETLVAVECFSLAGKLVGTPAATRAGSATRRVTAIRIVRCVSEVVW